MYPGWDFWNLLQLHLRIGADMLILQYIGVLCCYQLGREVRYFQRIRESLRGIEEEKQRERQSCRERDWVCIELGILSLHVLPPDSLSLLYIQLVNPVSTLILRVGPSYTNRPLLGRTQNGASDLRHLFLFVISCAGCNICEFPSDRVIGICWRCTMCRKAKDRQIHGNAAKWWRVGIVTPRPIYCWPVSVSLTVMYSPPPSTLGRELVLQLRVWMFIYLAPFLKWSLLQH